MLHHTPLFSPSSPLAFLLSRLSLFFHAFWLLSILNIHAQRMTCHELPTQQQLPVANVNTVIQDSEGYMWYGTAGGGLCRDDGYTVTTYSSETLGKGIMENDEVTCMAEDHQGCIWFGTRIGTYRLSKKSNTLQRINNPHVGLRKVNCIGVTHDGCVWVGIEQDIVKFSPEGTFLKALSISSNKREEAKEMMTDSKGTLWITILRGGIATINPSTDQLTYQPWDYPAAASCMAEDTLRHCYWVGTWGGGIVRYPSMEVESTTLRTTESQNFGSEVHNLWIDPHNHLLWASTMDDVYAYDIITTTHNGKKQPHLRPHDISHALPRGKKIVGKLFADRHKNIWVPGTSPHTFILSAAPSGSEIHREEVQAMAEQMGYKIMVSRIACEGDYFWIYQNRTRLSLYHATTGHLTFMATHAIPTPLSTQKVLSKCQSQPGVWTCYGKRLIHAWHEGTTIHWAEVPEVQLPNYITALSDEGRGRLLIGTNKQVFLYDYHHKTLRQLTDSVGTVQQVGYDHQNQLTYTTDPQAPKVITDTYGHIWTLHELTLHEYSPKTGASRTLHASDRDINMDSFSDITLTGDSICLGGSGAYCLIGSSHELDLQHPTDSVVVTRYDTLRSISLSTMNHLHATTIQFAYRFSPHDKWTELSVGANTIDIHDMTHGSYTLLVKATDEYGVWHPEQEVFRFSIPQPWWLRWWAWCIYTAIAILLFRLLWHPRKTTPKTPHSIPHHADSPETPEIQPSSETPSAPVLEDPFITQVTALVQQNLDNADYNVEKLSQDLGMSRMNMYRKFQTVSDTSPSEFMRLYRLRKAAELLKTTTKPITEIAYEVGFTSPQYLAKCFKDEFGTTPKQYRSAYTPNSH